MYARWRRMLVTYASVTYCYKTDDCLRHIHTASDPHAVLVVDAGITQHGRVVQECARYMRNGGRVVSAANFANYMDGNEDVRHFFSKFGCFWHFARVRKGVPVRKAQTAIEGDTPSVAWDCCPDRLEYAEAHLLGNVKEEHAAYHLRAVGKEDDEEETEEETGNEDDIPQLTRSPARLETPIVWAKKSHGYIGVIGDVNAQRDADVLVLAMLDLLKSS
jgi:hypothetical protein